MTMSIESWNDTVCKRALCKKQNLFSRYWAFRAILYQSSHLTPAGQVL